MRNPGRAGFGVLRRLLDYAFGPGRNPLDHLGALTIFCCWIVLVSGVWLLIFFRTSVEGAYDSVQYLTHEQWYLGGVMRSLHRYASDAAVVTLALHIGKEFSFDRYRSARWFSWITGVPLVWLLIPLGITGYWLVWDELAEYVALTSAELIDWLPVFTDSMARNFLSDDSLSDRFFTLMGFLHLIALPLLLVFGLWLHLFRLNGARINPPRGLMAGVLLTMLALSLVHPAMSQGRADLARVPESLGLDWYYLTVYPLLGSWSPGWVWALLAALTAALLLAPWLPPAAARPVAVVDLDNCNGCRRCVEDCPFGAVLLAPRSDGKPYEREAVVAPDLCLSCGICVGACPTATPFRTRSALVPGIDLPGLSAAALRTRIEELLPVPASRTSVLVVACRGSSAAAGLRAAGEALLEVECMAQLPPSFFDYALGRRQAAGVFLGGCAGGDCRYRMGAQWTEQRVARSRDPRLRARVEEARIALSWQAPWSAHRGIADALAAFRSFVADRQPATTGTASGSMRFGRMLAGGVAGTAFALLIGWLSIAPRIELREPGEALVSLSLTHAGQRISECRTLSAEELAELPPNMRNPQDCPRERHSIRVEFRVDDRVRYRESRAPSGIWSDGEATVYARLPVSAGDRRLFIGLSDSGLGDGFDYEAENDLTLSAGQHLVVEFDPLTRRFVFK